MGPGAMGFPFFETGVCVILGSARALACRTIGIWCITVLDDPQTWWFVTSTGLFFSKQALATVAAYYVIVRDLGREQSGCSVIAHAPLNFTSALWLPAQAWLRHQGIRDVSRGFVLRRKQRVAKGSLISRKESDIQNNKKRFHGAKWKCSFWRKWRVPPRCIHLCSTCAVIPETAFCSFICNTKSVSIGSQRLCVYRMDSFAQASKGNLTINLRLLFSANTRISILWTTLSLRRRRTSCVPKLFRKHFLVAVDKIHVVSCLSIWFPKTDVFAQKNQPSQGPNTRRSNTGWCADVGPDRRVDTGTCSWRWGGICPWVYPWVYPWVHSGSTTGSLPCLSRQRRRFLWGNGLFDKDEPTSEEITSVATTASKATLTTKQLVIAIYHKAKDGFQKRGLLPLPLWETSQNSASHLSKVTASPLAVGTVSVHDSFAHCKQTDLHPVAVLNGDSDAGVAEDPPRPSRWVWSLFPLRRGANCKKHESALLTVFRCIKRWFRNQFARPTVTNITVSGSTQMCKAFMSANTYSCYEMCVFTREPCFPVHILAQNPEIVTLTQNVGSFCWCELEIGLQCGSKRRTSPRTEIPDARFWLHISPTWRSLQRFRLIRLFCATSDPTEHEEPTRSGLSSDLDFEDCWTVAIMEASILPAQSQKHSVCVLQLSVDVVASLLFAQRFCAHDLGTRKGSHTVIKSNVFHPHGVWNIAEMFNLARVIQNPQHWTNAWKVITWKTQAKTHFLLVTWSYYFSGIISCILLHCLHEAMVFYVSRCLTHAFHGIFKHKGGRSTCFHSLHDGSAVHGNIYPNCDCLGLQFCRCGRIQLALQRNVKTFPRWQNVWIRNTSPTEGEILRHFWCHLHNWWDVQILHTGLQRHCRYIFCTREEFSSRFVMRPPRPKLSWPDRDQFGFEGFFRWWGS